MKCQRCGGNVLQGGDGLACIQCGAPHTKEGELASSHISARQDEAKKNLTKQDTVKPSSASTSASVSRRKAPLAAAPQPSYRFSTNGTWYSPGEITFRRNHVLFLLQHLNLLREGSYPPSGKETGYTETGTGIKGRQFKPGGKFETAAGLAAELDLRIQKAGQDGIFLEFIYGSDFPDKQFLVAHLANALGMETWDIERRIHTALSYVGSGSDRRWHDTPKRKGKSYKQFWQHR